MTFDDGDPSTAARIAFSEGGCRAPPVYVKPSTIRVRVRVAVGEPIVRLRFGPPCEAGPPDLLFQRGPS